MLIERIALITGVLAKGNIKLIGAGEVQKRVGVFGGCRQKQI